MVDMMMERKTATPGQQGEGVMIMTEAMEANARRVERDLYKRFKHYCIDRDLLIHRALAQAMTEFMSRPISGQEKELIEKMKTRRPRK